MNEIWVHWCYIKNFGDALNPYIISKLSGLPVKYCNHETPNYFKEIKTLMRAIKNGWNYDYNRLKKPIKKKNVILGIGSLLDRSLPNFHVWGSGYMNKFERAKGGTLHAVRGRFSAEKLAAEGFTFCDVWGDPALLMSLIYLPCVNGKTHTLGITPHLKDYQYFKDNYPDARVINFATNDVENVVDEICTCRYILSSSLHGLIVAHAFGIPAILIKKADINTDGIKFKDYFDSVGIELYEGFQNFNTAIERPEDFFSENMHLAKIKSPLDKIQKSLLEAAPFPVLEKWFLMSETVSS